MGGPSDLETRLGVRFRDGGLLRTALTHPSAMDPQKPSPVWQRLEFLGDSVITFSLSDLLFRTFPDSPEGHLATMRARLVSGPSFCQRVAEIGLENDLTVHGAHRPVPPGILEDALEALLGAVYLDQGFEAARGLVERMFTPAIQTLSETDTARSPKNRLQEILVGRGQGTPEYRHDEAQGPDHQKSYTAHVFAGGRLLGSGTQSSKKAAESAAAEAAVALLQTESNPPEPVTVQETP